MSADLFLHALRGALTHELDIEWVPETGSTNDDLKRRARRAPLQAPLLLIADRQSAGRGTHGRTWRTAALALIFSLAVPVTKVAASAMPGLLSLAAAMAVARGASRATREKILVKWPNDVWAASGKAGGILNELVTDASGSGALIIGVGLNLEVEPGGVTTAGWPVTAIPTRVSMRDPAMRGEFLAGIVDELLDAFGRLIMRPDTTEEIIREWPLYDAFYGRRILWRELDDPARRTEGEDLGIDASGRLLMRERRGETRALSGELVSLLNQD